MIQQETRGELFRIETEKTYPFDYDELVDYGRKELDEDSRPTLSSHVENMVVLQLTLERKDCLQSKILVNLKRWLKFLALAFILWMQQRLLKKVPCACA